MKFATYESAVDWLFQQFPAYHLQGASAYNPGLKNIHELLERFHNPHQQLKFVHVGGTNGKGSVSNFLASSFIEAKVKVGLFTSPHIIDFTERIRVDGKKVESEFVRQFCENVANESWNIQPSFFEITWAMALVYFQQQGCELVVAEVGLGGRLDATNVITPLVSIITSISLDHTNLLGNTRELIAIEKAGIIKPHIPLVLGARDAEVLSVFEHKCDQENSPLLNITPIDLGLIGFQRENADLAYTAWLNLQQHFPNLTADQFIRGVQGVSQNTQFYGRMQEIAQTPLTIADSAHNPDGIRRLFEAVEQIKKGQLYLIYGTSSDKDVDELITHFPENATLFITEFSNPRAMKVDQLTKSFEKAERKTIAFHTVKDAYDLAQQLATQSDTILIFGSFFLLHDFFSNIS